MQPCFPMSGFMNSHSQCPKICKTTILTLVKKEITLNEFNEDLKKCPWRCSLNENVIMSTLYLVPYEEARNKFYSGFWTCYSQSHWSCLNKANRNWFNEALFLSSAVLSSIFYADFRNYILRQENSKLVSLWANLSDFRGNWWVLVSEMFLLILAEKFWWFLLLFCWFFFFMF